MVYLRDPVTGVEYGPYTRVQAEFVARSVTRDTRMGIPQLELLETVGERPGDPPHVQRFIVVTFTRGRKLLGSSRLTT
jgi:hypothetical protein